MKRTHDEMILSKQELTKDHVWDNMLSNISSGAPNFVIMHQPVPVKRQRQFYKALTSETNAITIMDVAPSKTFLKHFRKVLRHNNSKITRLTLCVNFEDCQHVSFSPLWNLIASGKTSIRELTISHPGIDASKFPECEREETDYFDFQSIIRISTSSVRVLRLSGVYDDDQIQELIDIANSKTSRLFHLQTHWRMSDITHEMLCRLNHKLRSRSFLFGLLASKLPHRKKVSEICRLPNELFREIDKFLFKFD
jgi:hypothetical protein